MRRRRWGIGSSGVGSDGSGVESPELGRVDAILNVLGFKVGARGMHVGCIIFYFFIFLILLYVPMSMSLNIYTQVE